MDCWTTTRDLSKCSSVCRRWLIAIRRSGLTQHLATLCNGWGSHTHGKFQDDILQLYLHGPIDSYKLLYRLHILFPNGFLMSQKSFLAEGPDEPD